MKKFLFLFMTLMTISSCSANEEPPAVPEGEGTLYDGRKVLVAFFPWGGTTRRMAQAIDTLTGDDLYISCAIPGA